MSLLQSWMSQCFHICIKWVLLWKSQQNKLRGFYQTDVLFPSASCRRVLLWRLGYLFSYIHFSLLAFEFNLLIWFVPTPSLRHSRHEIFLEEWTPLILGKMIIFIIILQGWVSQCFSYSHKMHTLMEKETIEVERFVYETDRVLSSLQQLLRHLGYLSRISTFFQLWYYFLNVNQIKETYQNKKARNLR